MNVAFLILSLLVFANIFPAHDEGLRPSQKKTKYTIKKKITITKEGIPTHYFFRLDTNSIPKYIFTLNIVRKLNNKELPCLYFPLSNESGSCVTYKKRKYICCGNNEIKKRDLQNYPNLSQIRFGFNAEKALEDIAPKKDSSSNDISITYSSSCESSDSGHTN